MYPDQTVLMEQSDLGPYCLQYRIHRQTTYGVTDGYSAKSQFSKFYLASFSYKAG